MCPCSVIGRGQGHNGREGGVCSGPRPRRVCGSSPSPLLLLHFLLIHTPLGPAVTAPRAANTRAHTHTHFLSWWPWWLAHQFVRHVCFRMLGDSVIPLPHIYGARMKGVEIFCPLDPPPPYEAVAGSSTNAVTRVEFLLAFHWLIAPLLMDFWGWYWVIEFCQKHSRVHLLHTLLSLSVPSWKLWICTT